MTSRRFESIATILADRPTVRPEPADGHGDGGEEAVAAGAGGDATITRLGAPPAGSRRIPPVDPNRPDNPSSRIGTTTRASDASDGGVRRIAFRLDPALHSALRSRAAAEDSSQGQIVLDAVEVAHQRGILPDLIAADSGNVDSNPGMFPRLKGRAAARATVPVEIRLHARAVDILDQLAEQLGADSRTHLITLALQSHLTDQS